MSVTLDGQALFDEASVQIRSGSPARACVERSVCGLDGMLSIDLGRRARTIRQRGTLRAASRTALRARIEALTRFIDGDTHTLVTGDGRSYGDLRMDAFNELGESTAGPGVLVEYEIVYTQLEA